MLVDIPLERIPLLCSLLEKEWPHSIEAVNNLRRYHIWKKNVTSGITLLHAEDSQDSGVLVNVHKGYLRGPVINFYSLNEHEQTLKDELLTWNFSWPQKLLFDSILPKYIPLEEEIARTKGYKLIKRIKLKYFVLPIEKALKLDTQLPDDVEFGPLPSSFLDELYKSWVMNDHYRVQTLQEWYAGDPKYSVALFSKTTGTVLSTCMRNYDGKIAALHTVPAASGKGYATMLMRKVSKMLAEDSIEPRCTAWEYNQASLAVISKVGFEHVLDEFVSDYERSDEVPEG